MTRPSVSVECFFDCSSPWTYLAFHAVQPMAERLGVAIDWRPVLVGGIFNEVNRALYELRDNPPCLPKAAYSLKDMQDWARLYGLTINFPPSCGHPVNAVKVMRACCAIQADGARSARLIPFAKAAFETLWRDVRRGWNDEQGGGIAWRKTQLDYKNAPANAPAVIVGARLYEARHRRRDLEFALRVDDWLTRHLVDPDTGFVWDGVNRKGDGRTDKGWAFSYNQGVRIGAGLALFEATDDERHRAAAARTFEAARARLCDEQGVLRERGDGDGALFKGILVRYATDLALRPDVDVAAAARAFVLRQAEALWSHTEGDREHDDTALAFSSNWRDGSGRRDELAAQLSAVMLLECAARLERAR